jgi:hypothetical protein
VVADHQGRGHQAGMRMIKNTRSVEKAALIRWTI